jgi:hypothetical protein
LIHISIGKSLSNFSDVIHGGAGSWWDLGFLVFGTLFHPLQHTRATCLPLG